MMAQMNTPAGLLRIGLVKGMPGAATLPGNLRSTPPLSAKWGRAATLT